MSYGQDRYRRRFWVLPQGGGVFVEGMESGEGNVAFVRNVPPIEFNETSESISAFPATTGLQLFP